MVKPGQVRKLAPKLPETSEALHFRQASFRVREKILTTRAPEGDLLNVFVDEEGRQRAFARDPAAFEKLEWGGSVIGVQVNLAVAKPALVVNLLARSWSRKAPKKLAEISCEAKP